MGDQLNPQSANFDPLTALHAPSVPGLPDVEPLRSVAQFEEYQADPEAFLKAQSEHEGKQKLKQAAKQKAAADTAAAVQASDEMRRRTMDTMKNVLTRMELKDGPSKLLNGWVQSRTRVKVITRSFKGIRGTCTGFVVAFDKYFNLAMVDVDETYSSLWTDKRDEVTHRRGKYYKSLRAEQRLREAEAEQAARQQSTEVDLIAKRVESLNLTPTSNIKHRHLQQIFIRGDSVVAINASL